MFLSKVLINLCMIIHYIVEGNIFVVIIYKLLVQKILKCHIKDCFQINGKQNIKMFFLDSKIMKGKKKITIYDLCRF